MADHQGLRNVASRQHGLVTREQLRALGFSPGLIAHHVGTGRIDRLSPRVFRVGGSPTSADQRAMAAALDVSGGAVALASAAAMWEMPGFRLDPVHVITHRRPHRGGSRLGRMHSSVRFEPDEIMSVRGIPTTAPLRTLQDLAGRIHDDRLDQICERMLTRRILRLDDLHAACSTTPSRARGSSSFRRLGRAREGDYRPAESNLELRFEATVRQAGDRPFERQVELGDADGLIGRVDFVDRARKVAVEVQSALFHSARVDRARDEARFARLQRAGWTVLEVDEFDVWHRPELVLAKVRAARAGARRRPAR